MQESGPPVHSNGQRRVEASKIPIYRTYSLMSAQNVRRERTLQGSPQAILTADAR